MKKNIIILLFFLTTSMAYTKNLIVLNFDQLNGKGQFINGKDGQLLLPNNGVFDDITGTMYLSDDFSNGNYSTDFTTPPYIKTLMFHGVLVVDSLFYSAQPIVKKDELLFQFHKISFAKNSDKRGTSFAIYLDNNYFNQNQYVDRYFNKLKLIGNELQYNKSLEVSSGIKVISLLTKETFDEFKSSNEKSIDFISSFNEKNSIGYINYKANSSSSKTKLIKSNNFNSYTSNQTRVRVSVDKKITNSLKLGILGSFSDSESKIKEDNTYRDDLYSNLGVYSVFYKDHIMYSSLLSLGYDYGHLNRYNLTKLGSFKNNSTNQNYSITLNNSIYRIYQFSNSYIIPEVQFNLIELYQGKIKEKSEYGLLVDFQQDLSIELGLGIKIGRNFYINEKHLFGLSSKIMNYYELGTPYSLVNMRVNHFNKKSFQIDGYNNDRFRTKFLLDESYNYKDRFSLTLDESYEISKKQQQFKYSLNIDYSF